MNATTQTWAERIDVMSDEDFETLNGNTDAAEGSTLRDCYGTADED